MSALCHCTWRKWPHPPQRGWTKIAERAVLHLDDEGVSSAPIQLGYHDPSDIRRNGELLKNVI